MYVTFRQLLPAPAGRLKQPACCVQGADLLWYGDSIVEELRGTQMGKVVYEDVKAVFGKHFGSINSVVLGIAGGASRVLRPHIMVCQPSAVE